MMRLLLLAEGHTVSTLVNSGVHLVSAHHNAVQGTIVLFLAMMSALLNGTLDTLIGTIHLILLLCLRSLLVLPDDPETYWQFLSVLLFFSNCAMIL